MDTKGSSQKGKRAEILKEKCLEWVGLTRGEKIMVLDWVRSEMVVSSCLENLE